MLNVLEYTFISSSVIFLSSKSFLLEMINLIGSSVVNLFTSSNQSVKWKNEFLSV